jgi:hypothetical protein
MSSFIRSFSVFCVSPLFCRCAFFFFFFPDFQFFPNSPFLIPSASNSLQYLKMAKDGNDSDGLGDAHPALWEAHLTNVDEGQIRAECFIPKFIKIRFDMAKSGVVVRSNTHEICLYEAMFKAGFRLPFIPIVRELLGFLDFGTTSVVTQCLENFLQLRSVVAIGLRQRLPTKREGVHAYL